MLRDLCAFRVRVVQVSASGVRAQLQHDTWSTYYQMVSCGLGEGDRLGVSEGCRFENDKDMVTSACHG